MAKASIKPSGWPAGVLEFLGGAVPTPLTQKEVDEILRDLEEKKEKSTGGPEYHLAVLGQLGRTFTQLVFQGYHDRYFTLRDVAGLLNMKVTTVPVMEKAAFGLAG